MNLSASLIVGTALLAGSPGDLNNLQGEWILLASADENRPERGDDSIRMVIKNQTMTMLFAGLETNRGTFFLGRAKTAGNIDMTFGNGKSVLGIYELTGDILTICVAEAGNCRPVSLAPKGSQWQEKWKRVAWK
jgi:uncharacterized protein (TIGR03067 family)